MKSSALMKSGPRLPPLAVGLGIYLPTSTTLMVVVGALVGAWFDRRAETWQERRCGQATRRSAGVGPDRRREPAWRDRCGASLRFPATPRRWLLSVTALPRRRSGSAASRSSPSPSSCTAGSRAWAGPPEYCRKEYRNEICHLFLRARVRHRGLRRFASVQRKRSGDDEPRRRSATLAGRQARRVLDARNRLRREQGQQRHLDAGFVRARCTTRAPDRQGNQRIQSALVGGRQIDLLPRPGQGRRVHARVAHGGYAGFGAAKRNAVAGRHQHVQALA